MTTPSSRRGLPGTSPAAREPGTARTGDRGVAGPPPAARSARTDRGSGPDPVALGGRPDGSPGGPRADAATRARATRERSYARDHAQVLRRLARLEGQVRGIARMIERDEDCVDILQQTSALRAAVDAVAMLLMEEHVAGCLKTAVQTGDAEAYTDEVMDVVRRSLGRPARARSSSET